MKEYCEALDFPAFPILRKDSQILYTSPLDRLTDGDLPIYLIESIKQLGNPEMDAEQSTFMVELEEASNSEICLQFCPEPWVFYDAPKNSNHATSISIGFYLPDCLISSFFVEMEDKDILNKQGDRKIEIRDSEMHNSLFLKLKTGLPLYVFYSFILFNPGNHFSKVMISKFCVSFTKENIFAKGISDAVMNPEIKIKLSNEYLEHTEEILARYSEHLDCSIIYELINLVNDENYSNWMNFIHYLTWVSAGKPIGDHNFGQNQFDNISERPNNQTASLLEKLFRNMVKEILDWINEV